jgi:DNA-binding MarR family transcriptional regulator
MTTKVSRILSMLPATNSQIAEEFCTDSGDVARTMAKLVKRGLVTRTLSEHRGRGFGCKATYYLAESREHAA